MKIQRLVVEDATTGPLAVDFHDQLTVVTSRDHRARQRAVTELIGALGPADVGRHIEFTDHDQRRLAGFRPAGGAHMVVDIDRAEDLTPVYATADHRIDLLRRAGLDTASAEALMCLSAAELAEGSPTGTDNPQLARSLAAIDQGQLWPAAERLVDARQKLRTASDDAGCTLGEAQQFELLSQRCVATREAEDTHRSSLLLGLMIGGFTMVGALLIGRYWDPWTARWLIPLGIICILLGLRHAFLILSLRGEEKKILADTGSTDLEDYQRRSGRVGDATVRTELVGAGQVVDNSLSSWSELTQDAPVDWAIANKDAITRLAAQQTNGHAESHAAVAHLSGATAEAGRALVGRLAELDRVGLTQERLPLFLIEPLDAVEPAQVSGFLQTVHRLSRSHQIVLVTGNAETARWARSLPADDAAIVDLDASVAVPSDEAAPQPV